MNDIHTPSRIMIPMRFVLMEHIYIFNMSLYIYESREYGPLTTVAISCNLFQLVQTGFTKRKSVSHSHIICCFIKDCIVTGEKCLWVTSQYRPYPNIANIVIVSYCKCVSKPIKVTNCRLKIFINKMPTELKNQSNFITPPNANSMPLRVKIN